MGLGNPFGDAQAEAASLVVGAVCAVTTEETVEHADLQLGCEAGASLGEKLPGAEFPPGLQLETNERHAAVRAAVNSLPDELRECLVLAEWEEKPVKETAAILNLTPKAVETRLYRARKQLREQLTRWLRG